MLHKDKIEGVIDIIEDGLKDSHMLLDLACDAKQGGEKEAVVMFHSEAAKRLSGAKDWYDKCRELLHDPKNSEEVAKVFLHHMEDKLSHAVARSNGFKV